MTRRLPLLITVTIGVLAVITVGVLRTEYAVLAATGIALSIAAWWTPRAFVGAGLVTILFSAVLRPGVFGDSITLLDEVVALIALVVLTGRRLASGALPVLPTWVLWFGCFLAAGLMSSLLGSVPTAITFQAAFLALKGVVLALGVAQVDWRARDLRPFALGGAAVVAVIFLTCLINLAAPSWWVSVVNGTDTDYGTQWGIPVLVGPFEHPAALGRISALLAVAALSYRVIVGGGWKSLAVTGMAAFPAILAFRAKTFVSLGIGVLLTGVLASRRIPRSALVGGAVTLAIIAVPVAVLAYADFQAYFLTESARSAMTLGAVDVAGRNAPWGAGFGRYGSYLAGIQYSPEYVRLGFENIYGLTPSPNLGPYLNDTQWPAILGEAGWIGAAVFLAGLVHMGVSFLRRPVEPGPLSTWLRITALVWLIVVIVESIAAPVFTSAPSYPLPFVAAAMYWSISAPRSRVPIRTLPEAART
jgi:hypothetical protein